MTPTRRPEMTTPTTTLRHHAVRHIIPAILIASASLIGVTGCAHEQSGPTTMTTKRKWVTARSGGNPLLTTASPGMVAEHGYRNVNGPSVIRVPDWIHEPLGRYYLYFAHHRGSFIRLAYADSLEGPWTVSEDRVLELANTPALDHVASPDVHVDPAEKVVRMYYHSVDDTTGWVQTTYVALSPDGLHFDALPDPVGPPYMRVFRIESDASWWAIAKVRGGPGGLLLRSESKFGPFEEGPLILRGMRHGAVLVEGSLAHVFFSRIGDSPERLLVTPLDPEQQWAGRLDDDGVDEGDIREILRPEMEYEGANLPIEQSEVGEADRPVHALRDPAIFSEGGRSYLFYSIAGESGIAVALLD